MDLIALETTVVTNRSVNRKFFRGVILISAKIHHLPARDESAEMVIRLLLSPAGSIFWAAKKWAKATNGSATPLHPQIMVTRITSEPSKQIFWVYFISFKYL